MLAGYSGTPLVKKLGISAGCRLVLMGAPAGFERTLEGMPEGVRTGRTIRGRSAPDVVVLFAASSKGLASRLERAAGAITADGGVWVAWPKKASGVRTDLTETEVRAAGLATGLVDNKVCAIDAVWSGLRFVRRLADRGR